MRVKPINHCFVPIRYLISKSLKKKTTFYNSKMSLIRAFIFPLEVRVREIVLYLAAILQFPNFPGVHWWSIEKAVWTFGSTCPLVFQNSYRDNFLKLPCKTSMVELFLSTLADFRGSFPKNCLGQIFCREPDSTYFCNKGLWSRRGLGNFPKF